MLKRKYLVLIIAILSLGLLIVGCSNDEDGGELALYLADAPVNEIAEVNVGLDRVEVKREGHGWETINDFDGNIKTFDLLTLRFDEELLGQKMLPSGNYNKIRLFVAANEEGDQNGADKGKSYVVYQDERENEDIFIPGGIQAGLQIDHEFTIQDGVITRLILDADVRKILNDPQGFDGYILRRTAISVIDRVISGDVEGRVIKDEGAVTEHDVTVEAVDNNGDIITSTVATTEDILNEEDEVLKEAGSFKLRGLEEGTYTIHASVEIDGTTYQAETEVEVNADQVTSLDEKLSLE